MIVHSTAYPSFREALRIRKSALMTAILCLLLLPPLCASLTDVEQEPRRRVFNIAAIPMASAWLIGTTYVLLKAFRNRNRRVRIVATSRSLARHVEGRRATFIRRVDCVAIGGAGGTLFLRDGRQIILGPEAPEAEPDEAFLLRLYDMWWPYTSLQGARSKLEATRKFFWLIVGLILLASLLALCGLAIWVGDSLSDRTFVAIVTPTLAILILTLGYVHFRVLKTAHCHCLPIDVIGGKASNGANIASVED